MIDVIFVCVLGNITKEIKSGIIDINNNKECMVMIDDKKVGSANKDLNFCSGLVVKVKQDMEKKRYKCNEKVSSNPV